MMDLGDQIYSKNLHLLWLIIGRMCGPGIIGIDFETKKELRG
jgi:hypothetical protein